MVDIIDTKQTSVELINLADVFSKFFFCCLRMVRKSAFDFKYRLIAEFVSKSLKESDTTERLTWTELIAIICYLFLDSCFLSVSRYKE